MFNIFHNPS